MTPPLTVAHLSDLHISDGPRWDACEAGLRTAWGAALDLDPTLIVITGDLYGTSVPYRSQPRERNLLAELIASSPVPVVIVLGNHDDPEDCRGLEHISTQSVGGDGVSGQVDVCCPKTRATWRRSSCVVITEPSVVVWEPWRCDEAPELDLLCVPYRASGVGEALTAEPARGVPRLLCAHGAIAGARQSGGEVMREEPEIPRDVLEEGIRSGWWSGCLLGHLHHGQAIYGRDGRPFAAYPGPPWRPDWRDERTTPGLVVWRWEGDRAIPEIVPLAVRPMVTREATWTAEGWALDLAGTQGADLRVRASWDIAGPPPDLAALDRLAAGAAPAYWRKTTTTTGARPQLEVATVSETATDRERLAAAAEALGVEEAGSGIEAAVWALSGDAWDPVDPGALDGRLPWAAPDEVVIQHEDGTPWEPEPSEAPDPRQPSLFG